MVATINLKPLNELLLLSGQDIPFESAGLTLHPLTMGEIALIGEEKFFIGCELLRFTKDILSDEDKINLSNYSDFQILMSILNDKSVAVQPNISAALAVLDLLFPSYDVTVTHTNIICAREGQICGSIDDRSFDEFKAILEILFCLKQTAAEEDYNAQGELAKKIANKFKKRKQKLAELKPASEKVAIFSKYISILTVGEHKDINSFMQYTVYQLFDEFQRFQLKYAQDIYLKARLAGAQDLKEPEDWMKSLHS